MDTDKQFYRLLEHWPALLFELCREPVPQGPLVFSAPVLKGLERRVDAVIASGTGRGRCLAIVEIEAGRRSNAYTRLVTEMALLQEKSRFCKVRGVLLFLSRAQDAAVEPWVSVVERVYLDEEFHRLAATQPEHPVVIALKPLFEPRKEILEATALRDYKALSSAPLDEDRRIACLEVFISLLSQRLTPMSISRLFRTTKIIPFEETIIGRHFVRKGMKLGKAEGKAEAFQNAAVLTASARWPKLSASTLTALRRLAPDQSERLLRDIWKMADVADLKAWIKARSARRVRKTTAA